MDKARKNKDVSATKAEEKPVATTAATVSQEEKRRPVQTYRADDVSASIWVREHLVRGQMTKFWSVTLGGTSCVRQQTKDTIRNDHLSKAP